MDTNLHLPLVVFAIAAHPDDIEFGMAGTLLEFKKIGAEIHMWNLADGSCGTKELPPEEIVNIRLAEAQASAQLAGAVFHPPIARDLRIFYEEALLTQVAAVIREVKPNVLLVPSLQDYMEDHINTARLAITGAFAREMKNFPAAPSRDPYAGDVAIYHAMPNGGRDVYGRFVVPQRFVDITSVLDTKTEMLAKHASQRGWLRDSQSIDSYLQAMIDSSSALGRWSGKYAYAEGWLKHHYLGFAGSKTFDPMTVFLGSECCLNPSWESFEPE